MHDFPCSAARQFVTRAPKNPHFCTGNEIYYSTISFQYALRLLMTSFFKKYIQNTFSDTIIKTFAYLIHQLMFF